MRYLQAYGDVFTFFLKFCHIKFYRIMRSLIPTLGQTWKMRQKLYSRRFCSNFGFAKSQLSLSRIFSSGTATTTFVIRLWCSMMKYRIAAYCKQYYCLWSFHTFVRKKEKRNVKRIWGHRSSFFQDPLRLGPRRWRRLLRPRHHPF